MTPTNPSIQHLIDAFHQSLHGDSIVERKKSFHTYLNSLKTHTNGDPQKLSAVVDGIIPQDFWESVLRVDIILHYELFAHSLEVLQSGDKVLVSKLVKNAWFIKKLLETYTPQQFVDELFCFTSVSSRTRIINRLIKYNKDEVFGNQLFEAYAEKYGLRAAKQLLPLCPLHVIEDVVINKMIKPSRTTMRKVIGRDLKLAKHFFNTAHYRNNSDVRYIARTNLSFFMEFLRDDVSETIFGIGNSVTHKLISTHKSYIMENPRCLETRALNLKRVYFDLKEEYEQLVFKLIVARGCAATFRSFRKLLNPMPKQKQRTVFLNAFKEVAKCSLEERPDCICESFLQACEDVDERDKYAILAYNTEKESRWIQYMRIENSVQLLKEKLAFAAKPYEREPFINLLVGTCRINDDKAALLDVMKYVIKRFRNDKEDVRRCFVRALLEHYNLQELSREHWKCIDELEKLFEVNNEYSPQDDSVIHEQIILRLKNKEPIDDLVTKLYKNRAYISYGRFSSAGLEKEFILQSVACWNGSTEENPKLKAYLALLYAVRSYNSRHKNDPINIKQTIPINWLVERLEKGCEPSFSYIDSLFTYCILEDAEAEHQHEAIRVLFKKSEYDYNMLLHFVKNTPNLLMNNIDIFLESDAALQIFESQKLLKYYKRLSHLNLNQKVLDYFKASLIGNETDDKDKIKQRRIKSLKALSFCMDEDDYFNLIKQYHPDEAHLDTESDESNELYQYREAICQNLLNLKTPSKALDALLPFCVGDYLKFCLKSLYHLVFHTQEHKIPHTIDALKTKAVSVRKHAGFFSLATLDRKYNLQFFKKYIEQEQNPSVIAHVLKNVFKFFTNNLDNEFFEVFKGLLKKADKNDEGTLGFITKECVLPEVFVAEYVEFVWNAIEEFGRQGSYFEHTKFALLRYLKERDYILLDDQFLDRIVKENFLKENKLMPSGTITDVVVRYLIYCNSSEKQNFRLQFVFGMLRDFKQADINKALNSSADFVEKFCVFAVTHKTPTIELISRFKEHFNEFTDITESFNEHLDLDLLELHVKSLPSENYVTYFSEQMAYFLNDFEQKYGICLLMYSKHKIVLFIKLRLKKLGLHLYADNVYLFLDHFYAISDGVAAAILVIELLVKLETNVSYDTLTRERYDTLIAKLKSRSEPVVKVFLTSHFKHVIEK